MAGSGPGGPGVEYKDYYAVLGVPKSASQADIKKAFRKLARAHHPDTKPGDTAAERRFKEVNEANAVLSDPEKRALYDRLGTDWEAYARAGATAGAGSRGPGGAPFGDFSGFAGAPSGQVRYEFHTTADAGEFSDFFRMFFGGDDGRGAPDTGSGPGRRPTGGPGFEDILAGMGLDRGATSGSQGRARPASRKPPAAEAHAEITLDEAFHGTTRLVDVEGRRLEVTIPKGADTGTRIRLSGKAPGGGDLHVVVRQKPDRVFKRTGADLERELPLTLAEALLGAEVRVRTPSRSVLLTVPAGTQNGRRFRLTGQGMPRFRAEGRGDLYARARVVLPTGLSDEARAAAERLTELVQQPDPRASETR